MYHFYFLLEPGIHPHSAVIYEIDFFFKSDAAVPASGLAILSRERFANKAKHYEIQ